MKVKVGEIYKPISGKCNSLSLRNGSFIKITKIGKRNRLSYDILDKDKNKVGMCQACFKPEDLEPVKKESEEDSMKNRKYGVIYELKGQPSEWLKTEEEANERIEELLKDSSVARIYRFEVANLREVVRNEYRLVPVEKRGRPRSNR